jgi:hypothetical protein
MVYFSRAVFSMDPSIYAEFLPFNRAIGIIANLSRAIFSVKRSGFISPFFAEKTVNTNPLPITHEYLTKHFRMSGA